MQIINYEVFIPKSNQYDSKYKATEYEVGLENENFVVIKDSVFTVLNKTSRGGSSVNKTIDVHSISMWEMGFDSIDGIHYSEYSSHPVRPATIKRRIEAYIEKKYGFLKSVNLDFISEPVLPPPQSVEKD